MTIDADDYRYATPDDHAYHGTIGIDADDDLERPPDIRLPEIILGVTPDGRHVAIQTTIFIDPTQAKALGNALVDVADNLNNGYRPLEAK